MALDAVQTRERALPRLDRDTPCSNCGILLLKQTSHFTEYTDINGTRVVECDRCSALAAAERAEMAELACVSEARLREASDLYAAERADGLLGQSDMIDSMGGAADFGSWFNAAKETFGGDYAEPDMDSDFERIRAQSAAEMAAAASEWKEKTVYFTAPCDVGTLDDCMDYQNWATGAVEVDVNKHMTAEKRRWLARGEMAAAQPNAAGGAASGGAAGGGAGMAALQPSAGAAGGSS